MVAMYLDPEDWNELRALAEADGRSLSQMAARLIRPMLARGGPAQEAARSHEQHKAAAARWAATDPARQRRGDERPAKEDRSVTAPRLVDGITGAPPVAEDGAPLESVLVKEL